MKTFTKFYILIFVLFSNFIMFAQGDEDDNGNLEGNDPPAAPINTKLILLAITGILFAVYMYRNNRKKA